VNKILIVDSAAKIDAAVLGSTSQHHNGIHSFSKPVSVITAYLFYHASEVVIKKPFKKIWFSNAVSLAARSLMSKNPGWRCDNMEILLLKFD
ncbi:hypothetical protein TI04_13250, partial [Achromatium sp. WMS2]